LGVLRDETPGVGFGFDESVGFKDVSLPTSGTKLPCLSRRNPSHTIPRWYTPLRGFWVEAGIVVCVEWQPVSHSQSQAVTGSHVRSASHFTSAVARGTCQIHKSQITNYPCWFQIRMRVSTSTGVAVFVQPRYQNRSCHVTVQQQRTMHTATGSRTVARRVGLCQGKCGPDVIATDCQANM
jgi:hypothetical protein